MPDHAVLVFVDPVSDKADEPAVYTPRVFLDALSGIGWEPGVVPETVIYTYARFELFLATRPDSYTCNDMLGSGPGRFFIVNDTDNRVGINCLGIGPSATAAQLELQAELGVRNVLVIGTAGGLTPDQAPGDVILPTSAVRADGTSDHYAPRDRPARPDPELSELFNAHLETRGIAGQTAPCWTTAAPFRTTAVEIAYDSGRGVRAVEEEVAALFTVGAARGLRTAAALVLDGVPTSDGGWHIDLVAAQRQLQAVFTATVEFAGTL
jgi:uridine phosphorylase